MDTPEKPRRPRIVSREPDVEAEDDFNYFAFSAADRLVEVKNLIEQREKIHFELVLLKVALEGNPEPGPHDVTRTAGPNNTPIPCGCGNCELERVETLIRQQEYAIRKVRALYARLQ